MSFTLIKNNFYLKLYEGDINMADSTILKELLKDYDLKHSKAIVDADNRKKQLSIFFLLIILIY